MKRDDSLWKAILEDVFDDFLRFYFPNADDLFDFERPFEFLDKELEQLFPIDPDDFSPKYVDKLVKVFTKTGSEQWILVHIEVQGSTDKHFAQRMFQYFYRIYDKYQRPITAFAILTDTNKRFKPTHFEQDYLGTALRYEYNTYKILEQDEKELTESDNPFAMVVLTTLIALRKGKISEEDLLNEKIDLARRLLAKQFSKDKIRALMNFLKLYIRFGDNEKSSTFEQTIEVLTDKNMGIEAFVLDRERRIGKKEGMEEGIEKGIEKGMEAKTLSFVETLLSQTDFDDEKIATLAGVKENLVTRLRKKL